MQPPQNLTIASVALGGVVSVAMTGEDWDLFDSMVGILLLLVLLAYGELNRESVTSRIELIAVSSVTAFCALLAIGPLVDMVSGPGGRLDDVWFVVSWIVITAVAGYLIRSGRLAPLTR